MKQPRYITAWCTDIGIQKETNQDSALLMQAETVVGSVLLAVLCDGMGGLAKGEVASAAVIRAFREWFRQELPGMLGDTDFPQILSQSWNRVIHHMNVQIADYGSSAHIGLGTTVTAMLIVEDQYYIANVGDGRVYLLEDQIFQLTHDQTFVQKEIDAGRMTFEQATQDARRSVLLQCVGASPVVNPDYLSGRITRGQKYLLCCDGFRHVISPQEIYETLQGTMSQEEMESGIRYLIELNKQRQEMDNITALMIAI